MRILFLTQIVPYPPDAGPRAKTWQVLRYLASQNHEVHLVTFCRQYELPHLDHLKTVCASVTPVFLRRSRIKDLGYFVRSILANRSFLLERDDYPEVHQAIAELQKRVRFDILHADQLTMAQFITHISPGMKVFDSHNATWMVLERMVEKYPAILRPFFRREATLVGRFEHDVVRDFDHTFTVTEVDKKFLLDLFPCEQRETIAAKISTTPITIDCDRIKPVRRNVESRELLTLGTLHYLPNQDGIRWFLREIFPLVLREQPDVHLSVVGKNPPQDFIELARSQPANLTVTGYVDDLEPYYQKCACVVVPVRSGGGMRVRILEAFAYGLPVVTTTVGLEGINALPETDVLVEDSPQQFAAAVLRCLSEPETGNSLAVNGRGVVETRYHWRNALKQMDFIYRDAEQ